MAQGQQLFLLSTIAILVLMILSTCNSYPLFNELLVPGKPTKFYSPNDVDRVKQYYDTMAHLRYWRRDIDELDDSYGDTLQNILRHDNDLQYER